jgi:HlyD family secretion protein
MRAAPLLAILAAGLMAAGLMAAGGYAYWTQQQASRVPGGLARANGQIEAERVDVATKLPAQRRLHDDYLANR